MISQGTKVHALNEGEKGDTVLYSAATPNDSWVA